MRFLRSAPLTASHHVTCPTCRTPRTVAARLRWQKCVPAGDLCCSPSCQEAYTTRLLDLHARHGYAGNEGLEAFVAWSGMLCDEVALAVQEDVG
jgi:hypothetical protein